jgi:hypothetical protein
MNALELNKWIDNSPYPEHEGVVILLRQQAAKIEVLNLEVAILENSLRNAVSALKKAQEK